MKPGSFAGQPLDPRRALREQPSQHHVLFTVLYRVQAEQGGLRGRIDLGRVQRSLRSPGASAE